MNGKATSVEADGAYDVQLEELIVGSYHDSKYPFRGKIADLLVVEGPLSDDDRNRVERVLAARRPPILPPSLPAEDKTSTADPTRPSPATRQAAHREVVAAQKPVAFVEAAGADDPIDQNFAETGWTIQSTGSPHGVESLELPRLETWTLATWVRASAPGTQRIVSLKAKGLRHNLVLGLRASWAADPRRWGVAHRDQLGTSDFTLVECPDDFIPENWYHLAATGDGDRLRLYVNGALVAQGRRRSSSLAIGPGTCVLGRDDTDSEFARLAGDILTLAIFDRALSPAEIREQIRAYTAP